MQGKLIVFEGGEGCGKTTQIQHLYRWLLGQKSFQLLQVEKMIAGVKLTREPGGTDIGKKVRQLLLTQQNPEDAPLVSKTELLLYAADRAQHVEETLRPWLSQGYWVLCDRYTDSTVAYQGYGRQLDLTLIDTLNQVATGGLKSDLTLWLNVPPDVGLARAAKRGEADRIEQASRDFHQRVHVGFTALASDTPLRYGAERGRDEARPTAPAGQPNAVSSGPTAEIDGHQSIEAVAECIQQVVTGCVGRWYPAVKHQP